MPKISIIVPVLDEAHAIANTLALLQPMRVDGAEVVVVDGGSRDATCSLARPLCDAHLLAPRGRASQMNAGAAAATGDVLLFLHADTMLPANANALIEGSLADGRRHWGRFDVTIAGSHPMLTIIAMLMNARSRLSGIATGDQAMFVRRPVFHAVGGFPRIPLMEDVALSRALKLTSPPAALRERVVTSARRWERHGVFRTMLLMWRLRAAYALGADPHRLARRYEVERTSC
jgi:rSAM/selenodomain-associated transferase 2